MKFFRWKGFWEVSYYNYNIVLNYHYYLFLNVALANCFSYAVGVADPGIIRANQMTTTSYYHAYDGYHPAHYGRLNTDSSWCSENEDGSHDWLQVDLGKTFELCGVATRGNGNGRFDEWVTKFKLSYSADESSWTTYLDTDGSQLVRHGFISQIVRSVKEKIVTNRVKAPNLVHIFLRPYKTNLEGMHVIRESGGPWDANLFLITWSQDSQAH